MMRSASVSSGGLGNIAIAAYAAPAFATQFINAPFANILPGMYAKYWGLDMGSIAVALLAARIFDAVTDPLVGTLSDRTHTRFGSRKPWMMAGVVITALSAWFVYVPPQAPSLAHLIIWSMLFYLGWTMIEIPHTAWGAELTDDYATRSRVFLLKTLAAVGGTLCMVLVPLLPIFESKEMTPDVMRAIALLFVAGAPFCIGWAVFFAPVGMPAPVNEKRPDILAFVRTIASNLLFLRFVAAFLVNGFASGMNGVMQYIYLDSYLKLGASVSYALGAGIILALAGLPIWYVLMQKLGKHKAWSLSLALAGTSVLMPIFLTPGEDALVPYMMMVSILALCSGAGLVAPYSVLADIVDYDRLRTGMNRTGAYFALFLLFVKANVALGGAAAFALLGVVGYNAAQADNTSVAVWGLKAAFAIIPAALFLVSSAVLWSFPLDARRHAIIRRRLDKRAGGR